MTDVENRTDEEATDELVDVGVDEATDETEYDDYEHDDYDDYEHDDYEHDDYEHDDPGNDDTSSDEVDNGVGDPIPVEEWLERVVTVTQELHRPEIVTDYEPQGEGREDPVRPTDATTNHVPEDPAFPDARPVARSPADFGRAGQPVNRTAVEPSDGNEIVGSFQPVVSTSPGPMSEMGGGGLVADGRIVIGIIQTPPNDAPSRPVPVGTNGRVFSARRIFAMMLVLLTLTGLGGVCGYYLADYIPERWTAEAEVVLDPLQNQPDRYLATQQVLIQSSTVLDRAVAELPVDRTYVEEGLKVFPMDASLALGITFADNDPDLARDVVNAVLASFLIEVSSSTDDATAAVYRQRLDEMAEQRHSIEQRLAVLEAANAAAEADELAPPYPGDVRRLTLESEQLLNQMSALEEILLNQEIDEVQRADAIVVTEPRILPEPTWPKPLAMAGVGMLIGAVLAILSLFLMAGRWSDDPAAPGGEPV